MNQAVSDRRLLKLADFLKTVPRKRFNYNVWVGDDWQGAKDLSCGTTACALGWATAMPAFQRLGLRLKTDSYGPSVVLTGTRTIDDSLSAAQEVFGLSFYEAQYLFEPRRLPPDGFEDMEDGPPPHATPKQVARHIERFVKTRQRAAS